MPPARVVLDACVIYDAAVRDLLLRLGFAGLFEPIWSGRILDECFDALARNRSELAEEQRLRLRTAMLRAFPKAAHSAIPLNLGLPDPDDVHVVGTAISAGAAIIVTYNLVDFPIAALQPLGVRAEHPDVFACALFDESPDMVIGVLPCRCASTASDHG